MARKPHIRVNYASDAAFLMRLSDAVGRDDRQALDWRRDTIATLNNLAARLLQADGAQTQKAKTKKA